MTNLIAKPIIDKKFWILTDESGKRGNIEQENNGQYRVLFDNTYTIHKNIASIRKSIPFQFADKIKPARVKKNTREVYGFDVGCRAYNPVWDVKRSLPIFTKTDKSRSWYAAGWYAVRQTADFEVIRNPKVILIQRYEYQGPFHSQQEAESACG